MKYILVPINFNEKGAGVIAYSVTLAQELGLSLKLLHILTVHGVPSPVHAHAGSVTYNMPIGEQLSERIDHAEKKLQALCNRVKNESNVDCDYTCKSGFVDIQILEQTGLGNIEMVIMGTPQHDTLLNQLLGSRSLKVINHSDVPVLLVPNNTSYFPIKNIVVGAQYEDAETGFSQWLFQMARTLEAKLHFIHVVDKVNKKERLLFKGYKKEINQLLPTDLDANFRLLEESSVDHGLRTYRQSSQADLIALRRSSKSGWDHLFSENVSKEMALETSVPLLIY